MEAKHLIVENGLLKVTGKPMPVKPMPDQHGHFSSHHVVDLMLYNKELESWKQEALVVSNPLEIKSWWYPILGNSLTHVHDGIYDAPAGLEYEVIGNPTMIGDCKYELANEEKFAILSFASPKEETPASKENIHYNAEEFKKWLSTPDGMRYTKWFFSEDEDGKVMYEKAKEEMLNKYTPASKEKPDFEVKEQNHVHNFKYSENYIRKMCSCGVYEFPDSRDLKIQSLEQEIERLREELKSKQ